MMCLSSTTMFRHVDEIQENTDKALEEQAEEEERLKVTETRDPSEINDPEKTEKEV